MTSAQRCVSTPDLKSRESWSMRRSPFFFSGPWQRTQCFSRKASKGSAPRTAPTMPRLAATVSGARSKAVRRGKSRFMGLSSRCGWISRPVIRPSVHQNVYNLTEYAPCGNSISEDLELLRISGSGRASSGPLWRFGLRSTQRGQRRDQWATRKVSTLDRKSRSRGPYCFSNTASFSEPLSCAIVGVVVANGQHHTANTARPSARIEASARVRIVVTAPPSPLRRERRSVF